MNFILRTIEPFVYPVGFIWLCLLMGAFAFWRTRQQRPAALCGSLFIFLWICGATPLSGLLLASVERPYLTATVASASNADAIVVLGGITAASSAERSGFTITSGAGRLLTGFELLRLGKAPILIFGGGPRVIAGKTIPEGELLKELIVTWNADATKIFALPPSVTTREEAMNLRGFAESKPIRNILLITSAAHLSRSLPAFRNAGFVPQPVACDFLGVPVLESKSCGFRLVPTSEPLRDIGVYIHEVLGAFYYSLRGWI